MSKWLLGFIVCMCERVAYVCPSCMFVHVCLRVYVSPSGAFVVMQLSRNFLDLHESVCM
jgi:hypothetical protein